MLSTYIECACAADEHLVRLKYFPPISDDGPALYMSLYVNHRATLWRRIAVAWRGIVHRRSRYGDFTEVVFTPESALQFRDVINKYLSAVSETPEAPCWSLNNPGGEE